MFASFLTIGNSYGYLKKLNNKITLEGYTLVPLKIYLVNGKVKVLLGLCKGKKNYDKRQTIKDRETKIRIERELKK